MPGLGPGILILMRTPARQTAIAYDRTMIAVQLFD
jgi:hypothetical protein